MQTREMDRTVVVAAAPSTAATRWLGWGLIVLGGGVALNALLGPLLLGAIEYHVSPAMERQLVGGEIVALLLVAPLAVVAGVLFLRGDRVAPLLALGPALYATYTYVQLGSGGDPAQHPGNSEMWFALHLGLIVLSGAIAVAAWHMVDIGDLPAMSGPAFRLFGWVTIGSAVFLALGLHLPQLVEVWGGDPDLPSYVDDPQVFWLVKVMDLALVVPAFTAIGIGALRRRPWAQKAVYGTVGGMALLSAAVAAMAIVMQIEGDPEAAVANVVVFVTLAAAFGLLASWLYAPLLRRRGTIGNARERAGGT